MNLMKRLKVIAKRLKNAVKTYFNETSFHGFHYIAQNDSSLIKSIFWGFLCLISAILCCILIRRQALIFQKNRISTVIQTTAYPIWKVPFPAVTICNFNIVQKSKMEKFRQLLRNENIPDDNITEYFLSLSTLFLHTKSINETNVDSFMKITRILNNSGYNTEILMQELAQSCENMTTRCSWKDVDVNCTDIFKLVRTNEGFCCSFNYKGNVFNLPKFEEELFVVGIGPSFGLTVHLDTQSSEYMTLIKNSHGFDVNIQENINYPDMTVYSTTVYPGSEISFSINPQIYDSEEDIKSVDISTRDCVFRDEVQMNWGKAYNFHTCISECKAKAIVELCGCTPFYFPLKDNVRYCNVVDSICLSKNSDSLKPPNVLIESDEILNQINGNAKSCNCYSQCEERAYPYQIDQEPTEDDDMNDLIIINVYFNTISCIKIGKTINLTWEYMLASIGGIIGLCLGGSILSIFELFYYIFDLIILKTKKNTIQENVKGNEKEYEPTLYITDFNSGIGKMNRNRNMRTLVITKTFKSEISS